MNKDEIEQIAHRTRELVTQQQARETGKSITYTDTDGCEVTVTPKGHVFYNASDWW